MAFGKYTEALVVDMAKEKRAVDLRREVQFLGVSKTALAGSARLTVSGSDRERPPCSLRYLVADTITEPPKGIRSPKRIRKFSTRITARKALSTGVGNTITSLGPAVWVTFRLITMIGKRNVFQ